MSNKKRLGGMIKMVKGNNSHIVAWSIVGGKSD